MADGSNSTWEKQLTFSGAMKVSLMVFYLPSSLWVGFLRALWLDGATANLTMTNHATGKLAIVSVKKRHVSVTVT